MVAVRVGVRVGVCVGVSVGVFVGVVVGVVVGVLVGVCVGAFVGVCVGVSVEAGVLVVDGVGVASAYVTSSAGPACCRLSCDAKLALFRPVGWPPEMVNRMYV